MYVCIPIIEIRGFTLIFGNKCNNEVEVQKVGTGTLTCYEEKMECIIKDLTAVNLMKAFAGESQARNKYEFFSELAREQGWHVIAEHFQEAADNEESIIDLTIYQNKV